MKQLVILAAFTCCVWGSRLPVEENTRINGGIEAEADKFLYVVSLRFANDGKLRCGGSIIHRKWVLTAGHCFIEPKGINPRDWFVVVGTNIHTDGTQFNGTRHDIAKVIRHEQYELTSKEVKNDIALLTLETEVVMSNHVTFILLNPQPIVKMSCYTVVWKKVVYPHYMSTHTLMYQQMQVISQSDYEQRLSPNNSDGFIYAFSKPDKGVDLGDSGGPLVDDNKLQIGINSGRAEDSVGKPNVFVRISAYYKWIRNYVGEL